MAAHARRSLAGALGVARTWDARTVKAICYPFAGLAAIGLVLSLAIHLLALTGRIPLSGGYWFLMHVGVFVVMIPAVLVSQFTTRDFKQKDQLKASLRGCPR